MLSERLFVSSMVLGLILLTIYTGTEPYAHAQDAKARPKIEIVPNIPHSDNVTSVAFSPDGARVVSGSNDKSIKLWDVTTGALLRTFQGHSGWVTSAAFSPDGTRLL